LRSRNLAIWEGRERDANSNGISEPGEVTPLAAWAIVELSCEAEGPGAGDDPKLVKAFSPAGVRFSDGTTRPTYDVVLQRRK